jgi:1-aminocyclopropane-1-carboxylate deaminase
MRMPKRFPVPIENIHLPLSGMGISVLREDLSHPHYGGNKYWKLIENIARLRKEGKTRLFTMGGAYSNHLYAAAALGQSLELRTVGIIRGEQPDQLSPTLSFARDCGMRLHFLSRADFRRLRHEGPGILEGFFVEKTDYWVPEGGSNPEGVQGCAAWAQEIPNTFDRVVLACGSGGSLAGLAGGKPSLSFLGINVLKGVPMEETVTQLQSNTFGHTSDNWSIIHDFHGGGYARLNEDMKSYMALFEKTTGILLDPIYTIKLFYALDHLALRKQIVPDEKILAIHTGGLQGRAEK